MRRQIIVADAVRHDDYPTPHFVIEAGQQRVEVAPDQIELSIVVPVRNVVRLITDNDVGRSPRNSTRRRGRPPIAKEQDRFRWLS